MAKSTTPNFEKTSEKSTLQTMGLIDIHFHGAFGTDLMSASTTQLHELSAELWKQGVAGFCATTLSTPLPELTEAVQRLGRWIRSNQFPGAIPLGIHLEGPYLNSIACGAHPIEAIRKFSSSELESLWEASLGTLKILTLAPESLSTAQLKGLVRWSQAKGIVLSLGHSKATESEAKKAFDAGFNGVTHAWNALQFHQREPGTLGAALGRKDVYLELIIDQVHVHPRVIQWTRDLHPPQAICFISDCISAGGFRKTPVVWQKFGPLQVRFKDGACRVADGHLAGGGYLLPEAYCRWVRDETKRGNSTLRQVFRKSISHVTKIPLRILHLSEAGFRNRRVSWQLNSDQLKLFPIDSQSSSR
jgi:N-acetylglucosamine-6-phosphate deacetylase